jgi:hypothetical protein
MMRLQLVKHTNKPGVALVEIWDGDAMVGAIYPTERGVKIVSKHFDPAKELVVVDSTQPIAIEIRILET